jgi:enoyl-CoA hydratase
VLQELSATLEALETTVKKPGGYDHCRVVVLRGAGSKAFVAGADIKVMAAADETALRRFIELGQRVMRQVELLPLPVIAVVDGFAIGGGMELALAADLIVGTERAKFGQAEVTLGVIPGFGGTQRLFRRSGVGAARRLILTGETIVAEEAQRFGLIDWLVPSEELATKLSQITATLKQKGPLALAAAKRAMRSGEDQALLRGLEAEREEFLRLFDYQDTREGLTAFIEKRKAQFRGV